MRDSRRRAVGVTQISATDIPVLCLGYELDTAIAVHNDTSMVTLVWLSRETPLRVLTFG